MSKTATATPPPAPYFPQRTTTPTMRHATSSPAHYPSNHHQAHAHKQQRRRTKNLPSSSTPSGLNAPKDKKIEGLGLSFEDVSVPVANFNEAAVGNAEERTISRMPSDISTSNSTAGSEATSQGSDVSNASGDVRTTPATSISDFQSSSISISVPPSFHSQISPENSMEIVVNNNDAVVPAVKVVPATPGSPSATRSWVPSFGKVAIAMVSSGVFGIGVGSGERKRSIPTEGTPKASTSSVMPIVPAEQERPLPEGILPPHSVQQSRSTQVYQPQIPNAATSGQDVSSATAVTGASPSGAGPEQPKTMTTLATEQSRLADYRRVHECARLCSQWPQSVYNMTKYGPNGCPGFYQPQSWSNPTHVASTMAKQAELEKQLCLSASTFFSCRRRASPSTSRSGTTDEDTESYESSQNSPRGSMNLSSSDDLAASRVESIDTDTDTSLSSSLHLPTQGRQSDHDGLETERKGRAGTDEREQKTREDIRLAMCSSIIPSRPNSSQPEYSPLLTASPKSLKEARSLTELNHLAISNKDESMDIDDDSLSLSVPVLTQNDGRGQATRPIRAQSCGAKRPAVSSHSEEEDKRRKVDEAMVVEDAVSSGVILPTTSTSSSGNKGMSASTPNLPSGNVFGHVVKTSSTHPIIVSPFFPTELLGVISANLVIPRPSSPASCDGGKEGVMMLSSNIDVPSLLLSSMPTPSSTSSSHKDKSQSQSHRHRSPPLGLYTTPSPSSANVNGNGEERKMVGNLLLSSCPGKRLRMEGPVKGRGPVCRDLKVDLERIKAEGVGCLVCCLDDTELALLGVPWETYRQVAADLELDVIRLPMPDGFTPVSMSLFDTQVSLIATKYTLRGVHVLIHCRGGVGRAGLTACAWAIKMGYVQPHPSLVIMEEAARRQSSSSSPSRPRSQSQPQPQTTSRSQPQGQDHQTSNSTMTSDWVTSISKPNPHSQSTSAIPQAENDAATTIPAELEHQIVMSIVERVIAMIRSRRGLKAIESFEQVQFLVKYTAWLRSASRAQGGC